MKSHSSFATEQRLKGAHVATFPDCVGIIPNYFHIDVSVLIFNRTYTLTSGVYILNHRINLGEWIEKAPTCISFEAHNPPRFLDSDPSKQGVSNKSMYTFPNLVSCTILRKKENFLLCKNISTSISKALPQNVASFISTVDHLYIVTLHRYWVIFSTSPEASDVHKRAGDLSILISQRLWFKRFHIVFFNIFLDAWCSFTFGY